MDPNEFREFGKAAIDFVADYLETIRDRDVLPSVEPGYLHKLLPNELPEISENWKNVLKDVENIILPGVTHWQSPNFHAYYPTATSYPSIVGEILSAGFGVVGFSWICSPACTELEAIVMDWLGKFLNLPDIFLNSTNGAGGGIIQGSASESILVAVLAAREKAVQRIKQEHPSWTESEIRGKLIAYSSDQSNSCVEKSGLLGAVPIKLLSTGDGLILKGTTLKKAIEEDTANGKIPILCIATLGTTGTCAYDNIQELAPVCQQNNIWLHVDAAYAGALFALPEYKHLLLGIDQVDSLNFNLHKIMMINFDCCAMWLKDSLDVINNFNVDRIYLKHNFEGQSNYAPDYRHWQIPLGRRFRSLKVWITLRTIGAEGFRKHFRNHINLAERFENYVLNDSRFEIVAKRSFGLVCFRPIGDNDITKNLLDRLMSRKKIYIIQACKLGKNFLRFVVCGLDSLEKDIDFAWKEITEQLNNILELQQSKNNEALKATNLKDLDNIVNKFSNGVLLNEQEKGK